MSLCPSLSIMSESMMLLCFSTDDVHLNCLLKIVSARFPHSKVMHFPFVFGKYLGRDTSRLCKYCFPPGLWPTSSICRSISAETVFTAVFAKRRFGVIFNKEIPGQWACSCFVWAVGSHWAMWNLELLRPFPTQKNAVVY